MEWGPLFIGPNDIDLSHRWAVGDFFRAILQQGMLKV